jgi:hypothetical protein
MRRWYGAPGRMGALDVGRGSRQGRLTAVIGLACLASGAAVVAHVATGVSLALGLLVATTVASGVGVAAWRRLRPPLRAEVKQRARYGLLSGVAATAAYDAARVLVVALLGFHVSPFAAIPLFGQAILGADASPAAQLATGFAYHYVNGIAFGVGYVVLFRYRRWWWGIGWALLLEAAMLTIYPGWLAIGALLDEFTVMSMTGHLAFGATLGVFGQRNLRYRCQRRAG